MFIYLFFVCDLVALQCIQEMGNAKAKRLYEGYIPQNFRWPQADQYPSQTGTTGGVGASFQLTFL